MKLTINLVIIFLQGKKYKHLNISYVEKTKYLGCMFTKDQQDDVEKLRQLRLL